MEYFSFLQQALEDFATAEESKVPIITPILFGKCVLHPILYTAKVQAVPLGTFVAHMADLGIRDRCNLFSRQQTHTVINQFILDSVCDINT